MPAERNMNASAERASSIFFLAWFELARTSRSSPGSGLFSSLGLHDGPIRPPVQPPVRITPAPPRRAGESRRAYLQRLLMFITDITAAFTARTVNIKLQLVSFEPAAWEVRRGGVLSEERNRGARESQTPALYAPGQRGSSFLFPVAACPSPVLCT